MSMTAAEAATLPWGGRPYKYAGYENRAELVAEIIERLAGGESIPRICRDAHMPNCRKVYEWCEADDSIAAAMAEAREIGEDHIADEALKIADGLLPATGGVSDAQRDKLRVDTRLKLLAKFNPKRWGDGLQLRHADSEGGKLDTAPLVSELLGLMGNAGSGTIAGARPAARPAAPPVIEAQARPVYRPRPRGVEDLV